ncbi:1144_t:CDS:1, partial [Cetraspora pellucida]
CSNSESLDQDPLTLVLGSILILDKTAAFWNVTVALWDETVTS